MRWLHLALSLLVVQVTANAAPLPLDGRPPATASRPQKQREEAQAYAQHLEYVLSEVEQNYVRPVSRVELVHAALSGLFEAARLPVRSTLRAEVEAADKQKKLAELIVRVRLEAGDHEAIRGPSAVHASVRAMMRALDPFSGLLTADELRRDNSSGTESGVGIELQETGEEGPVLIRAVVPGGPAQKAGLRPGDEITHINGQAPKLGLLLMAQLKGQGTIGGEAAIPIPKLDSLSLVVRRSGVKDSLKIKLEAESFRAETILGGTRRENNAWDFWLDREKKIAHIRVATLANGTAGELKQVLARLQADDLRGVLLDLRWCPGGYLSESLDVAQIFLGECTVATIKSRVQGDDTYRSVVDESKLLDLPLVVLVNAETSGGAELIAAALQDNKRAIIAGQRTRGKASVQTTSGMPIPNTGLKLTSGTFFRPSGKNLHRFADSKPTDDWGVRPEPKHDLRLSVELSRQLRDAWQQQTLRPGTSREALLLDDPRADPQRLAGLRLLLEQLK